MATKQQEKPPRGGRGQPAPPTHGPTGGGVQVHEWFRLLDGARYAAPWILGLVIVPALSILGRWLWAGQLVTRLGASAALVGVAVLLVLAVWDESRPRRNRWDRVRVAVSTSWVFGALVGTSWFGGAGPILVARPWADLMWGSGFVLALWWTLGALPAVAGRGDDGATGRDTVAEALGLGQSVVTDVEDDETGVRRTIRWRLHGVTAEALRAAAGLIAVRAKVPPNGVRVTENPDDAGAPEMQLVRKDVLRHMGPWPGASRPGGSIAEPVRSARREDGTDVEAVRLNRHKLVGGITGAGKTEGAIGELMDVITRRDVVVMMSDTVKPGQSIPDIAPALRVVATTRPGTKKLVLALQRAVEYRSSLPSGRAWRPTPKLPAILMHFEEGALVAQILGDDLRDLVATARSVGIIVTLSMQRPSHSALDTDTRAQFADRECYGVTRDDDADMILSEQTIEAGAAPQVWKDDYPGYHYREAGDRKKHAMPARTWPMPPRIVRPHVAKWAPRMAQLDAGTAAAMGDALTELTSGEAYALAHGWRRGDGGEWIPPSVQHDDGDDDSPDDGDGTAPAGPSEPGPNGSSPAGEATATGDGMTGDETSARDEHEDDGDELSEAERAEIDAERDELRGEIAEAIPVHPDIAEVVEAIERGVTPPDEPGDDFELWTGDGEPLGYAGRVAAVADELAGRIEPGAPGSVVRVRDVVDALTEVPGWHTGQRPAVYRLLGKAEDAGQAESRGDGAWWIEATCPAWLRRQVAQLEATDSDEAADDDEL